MNTLDDAIGEFLAAVQAGGGPDRDELLGRFPHLADELRAFFADHDRMVRVAEPLRPKRSASSETVVERVRGDRPPAKMSGNEPTLAPIPSKAGSAIRGGDSIVELLPASGEVRKDAARYFGGYELLAEVARGGMGVVYKARHLRLNRVVALKMILAGQLASRDDVQRFYAEAEAAAGLDHVGIVPVYEVAEHEGQHYFTMGFIEGESLADLLGRGPLSPVMAAELMKKIAEAVAYAHSKGIVHRDLKPANILLANGGRQKSEVRVQKSDGRQGESDLRLPTTDIFPRITDFGLAKQMGHESGLTATGQILGTPSYMPPEQAAGKLALVNESSDIYSLGAILYAMLTGRAPFLADSPLDILVQVLESEPTLPNKLQPGIPRPLEWICLKCLEKDQDRRYESATALAVDLDRFLRQEPVEARPADLWQRTRRWVRREPALASHLAALSIVLVIGQAMFIYDHRAVYYHLMVSGVLVAWGLSAFLFQWLLNRERWSELARYFWSAADVALLTALLALLAGPLDLLLVGYPLLVAASGLFFRVRLVAVTTCAAALACCALWLVRPSGAPLPHYAGTFLASLATLGFIIGYQVRRVRVLSQYYEHRELP